MQGAEGPAEGILQFWIDRIVAVVTRDKAHISRQLIKRCPVSGARWRDRLSGTIPKAIV